tara:strand:+ start:2 stop:1975 length:1974 start_codon:yes stop_codon:yes gene_type:complete
MAGIISHSIDTASPTANTRTYGLNTNEINLNNTDSIVGYVPQNFTSANKPTLNYLNTKGFAAIGNHPFNGLTVYHDNFSTYKIDYTSDAGGSSTIQSSADEELFGLGLLDGGSANAFKVRIIASQSFSDISSITVPSAVSNKFTSESLQDLSISDFGTSDGLTLAKIQSANPAVIPAAFQDGKFANVGALNRKYHASLTSATSVSASGYYRFHDIKVGIATGSGEYQFIAGATVNKFWAPIDQINTDIGSNSISGSNETYRPLSAHSRSLSGAPYLTGSTYEVSAKIHGLFNPLYRASTTLVDMLFDNSEVVGTLLLSGDQHVSTNTGEIKTSNVIYSEDGSTVRGLNTVPFYNDIAIVTASVLYKPGTNDNVSEEGFSDTTFTVTPRGRNRFNTYTNLVAQVMPYHSASTFAQHHSSGSMAVYGQVQGFDSNVLVDSTETFTGEDNRIILADNVQEFNGTVFTTNTYKTNDNGDAVIGQYDLQVKPGYLVNPLGDHGYWFTSDTVPGGAAGSRFYIRHFKTDGNPKSTVQIHLSNTSLVNWTSTSNGVACAILFQSSGKNSGNNVALSQARIYDVSKGSPTEIELNVARDNHKNPFTTEIDIFAAAGVTKSETNVYTFTIANAIGQYLNAADDEFYVIVRYKGDPTPIESINVSVS